MFATGTNAIDHVLDLHEAWMDAYGPTRFVQFDAYWIARAELPSWDRATLDAMVARRIRELRTMRAVLSAQEAK